MSDLSEQESDFIRAMAAKQFFDATQADRIQTLRRQTSEPFDRVVSTLGFADEDALASELAQFLNLELVSSNDFSVDRELIDQLGTKFLEIAGCVPIETETGEASLLCFCDPFDQSNLDMLAYALGNEIKLCVAPRHVVTSALSTFETESTPSIEAESATGVDQSDIIKLRESASAVPVVRLVSRVFDAAVKTGATDIHFEPNTHQISVRFRIDGKLREIEKVSLELLDGLVSRIKILGNLNISERRRPQDGSITQVVRGRSVEVRISILPSVHGETIVLRILDRQRVSLDLQSLGFRPDAIERLKAALAVPNGLVLVTGPTGSGKSTTLYALLNELDRASLKVITIEDPVEHHLDGIIQIAVNPHIDLTFAGVLRTALRQDPDVILIGEIRDFETAQIAVQASLTGHLVLATLHTNSAIGAVTRLRDMGVDHYMIAATLRASASQRLLRKICDTCGNREPAKASCKTCDGSGFRGRVVAYQIVTMNDDLRNAVSRGAVESELETIAMRQGSDTLHYSIQSLVEAGVTSEAEALRLAVAGS